MPKIVKLLTVFGFVALAAACQPQEEEVIVVAPEPLSTEPAPTGKF